MRTSFATPLLCCVAALLLFSCGKPNAPVTPQEAKALGARIEAAALRRDQRPIDSLMDNDLVLDRIVKETGKSYTPGFRRELKDGLGKLHWGTQIIGEPGSTYQLVKAYERDGKQHLIFRLYGGGGLNYHDYELGRDDNNVIRAADAYIYISGESISTTLSRLFHTLESSDDLNKQHIQDMKQMRVLVQQGDAEGAYRLFQRLPADVRKDKGAMVTAVQIGSQLPEGDPRYVQILEEYEAAFGDDPASSLILVDAYVLRKDWAKAMRAVNRLDSFINKDPMLDYYRANLYTAQEDYASAHPLLENLHRNMPDFEDGFVELIANVLITGDRKRADALIAEYKANKQLNQANLQNVITAYGE